MDPTTAIRGEGSFKSCRERLHNTIGLATDAICIAGFDEHHSRMVQRAHVRPLINEYIMTNLASGSILEIRTEKSIILNLLSQAICIPGALRSRGQPIVTVPYSSRTTAQ